MAILVDTGVFYANYNKNDGNHLVAKSIYENIVEGEYGTPILLDYIFDELVTLIQVRTKRNDIATEIGNLVLDQLNDLFTLFQVSGVVFQSAWELFRDQSGSKYLSFTDCVLIRTAKNFEIKYIASFDNQMKSFHTVITS